MSSQPTKRFLLATDFSEGADRALAVALPYARPLAATIDLVHVYPLPGVGVTSQIPGVVAIPPPSGDLLNAISSRLDELGASIRAAGVDYVTTTLEGSPADEIAAHARRVSAELIVIGTHGRTGLRRVLLGSVAEQVLRKAECPVLVVPLALDRRRE